MTNAVFNYKNDQFVSFQIKGHANYSEYGTDIVCAGITTATFTTLGLLQKVLNKNSYKYAEKDANIDFVLLEQNDSELVKQIIQNFIEVLENIEKQYPKHLKLKIAKI